MPRNALHFLLILAGFNYWYFLLFAWGERGGPSPLWASTYKDVLFLALALWALWGAFFILKNHILMISSVALLFIVSASQYYIHKDIRYFIEGGRNFAFYNIAFLAALGAFQTPSTRQDFLPFYIKIAVTVAVIGILQYIWIGLGLPFHHNHFDLGEWPRVRVYSTLGEPNNFACFLTPALLLTLPNSLEPKQSKTVLAFASLLLAILLSFSIAQILVAIVGLTILLLYRRRFAILGAGFALVVLVAVIGISSGWLQNSLLYIKIKLLLDGSSDSMSVRMQGLGLVREFFVSSHWWELLFGRMGKDGYFEVDNGYQRQLLNFGLLPLLVFAASVAKASVKGWARLDQSEGIVLLSVLLFLLLSANIHPFLFRFPVQMLFWMLLAYLPKSSAKAAR